MDNFQRQQSVWNIVKEHVPYSELPEIRAVLGNTLVDTCKDLYAEVEMWENIWLEIHYSEQGSRPETPAFPLADPPAIKELLKAEIQLLLLTLRKRAARHGRDAEEIMTQYSPAVVSYALGSSSAQRQKSPDTWCETAKSPSRPPSSLSEIGSRSYSSLSSHSSCEDEIRALKRKLNITHIDEVVSHLRSVLTEEYDVMERDVRVLKENIMRANRQRGPVSPEPTVAELKEERRIIQRDLEVQSLMRSSCTTNSLTIKKTQIQLRETRELASSPHNSERMPDANHQTVASGIYSFHLKPCPPEDHFRTSVSSKQRNRLLPSSSPPLVSPSDTTQHRTQEPCLNHDHSNHEKLFSGKSINLIDGNISNVELNSLSSALEHGDMSKKYRGTSAFRLVPAASAGESEAAKDLIKLGVTKDSELGLLQPAPPAVQRTASRGLRGSRRLCVPQPDSLLSSL
ncbi:coiled-coil domain-containing protein 24 [Triplophysa rosa]|uniref:Coiled-coil domain-containing protein 24 n=1 Tax=Triplophysa rosa TaxID=992332 RepID=A0A9W7WW30_TRIRA|nr:coiled-coil domain-containing protein 24 [Triplophysa rosa]KAI7809672.1 putative coiled-coil domain-containing protein 24 [Triplophysa rosa]